MSAAFAPKSFQQKVDCNGLQAVGHDNQLTGIRWNAVPTVKPSQMLFARRLLERRVRMIQITNGMGLRIG